MVTFLQTATLIAVYAHWGFANIKPIGWGWVGVIWLYSLVSYVPLDFIKLFIRYILTGKAWDLLLESKVWKSWNNETVHEKKGFKDNSGKLRLTILSNIRLPLQGGGIMVRNKGKPSGQFHIGIFKDCISSSSQSLHWRSITTREI